MMMLWLMVHVACYTEGDITEKLRGGGGRKYFRVVLLPWVMGTLVML